MKKKTRNGAAPVKPAKPATKPAAAAPKPATTKAPKMPGRGAGKAAAAPKAAAKAVSRSKSDDRSVSAPAPKSTPVRPSPRTAAAAPRPVASKASEPAKATDRSVSVHPAPMTPPSEAEPGPAALGSFAAVTGPAATPKGGSTAEIVQHPAAASARSASGNGAKAPAANFQAPDLPAPKPSASASPVREATETMRNAVTDNATATTRGLVELNGKMLEMFRVQGEAAFNVWRSTVSAPSMSEAIRAQTSGVRQAYETSAAQWKDLAETTGRVLSSVFTVRPK
jgi:hypothetical protein